MDLNIYNQKVFDSIKKSNPQRIRLLSENWFSSEMYCPSCLNEKVQKLPNNSKVADFFCEKCKNKYELKSASKEFKKRVHDGRFETMISSIKTNDSSNFFFMNYSNDDWYVKNLFVVPKFFINTSIIKKTSELKARPGYAQCDILLERIPEEGKIQVIKNEKIIDKQNVNKLWKKMSFLNNKTSEHRGWTSDVLKCVNDLKKEEFNLDEVYKFSDYLKDLHPENNNVQAKIRQQLQVLRDQKIIKFSSRGKYSRIF